MGVGKAFRTSVSRAVKSVAVADRSLFASYTSPDLQSRRTDKSSWPKSGCTPSRASATQSCPTATKRVADGPRLLEHRRQHAGGTDGQPCQDPPSDEDASRPPGRLPPPDPL